MLPWAEAAGVEMHMPLRWNALTGDLHLILDTGCSTGDCDECRVED